MIQLDGNRLAKEKQENAGHKKRFEEIAKKK